MRRSESVRVSAGRRRFIRGTAPLGTGASRRRAPSRVAVRGSPSGAYRVQLSGVLLPGWCGNLAAGLARAGISIQRGLARRGPAGTWHAQLELARTEAGVDPRSIDYMDLATRESEAGFGTPIVLDAYQVTRVDAHGGALRLDVSGPDVVGFLGALLRRLAYQALFPVELRIETRDGRAEDRLWLRSIGGGVPSPEDEATLEASLERLLRRKEGEK